MSPVLIIPTIIAFVALFCFVLSMVVLINQKSSPSAIYNKGVKEYKNGEYTKALELFQKALKFSPMFTDARFMTGSAYFMMQDYNSAMDCFAQMIKSGIKDYDTLYNYALSLQMKKKYPEAMKVYYEVIKIKEKSDDCYFNMGKISFDSQNLTNALDFLSLAHRLNSGRSDILFYLTRTKDELCSYEEEEEYQEILNTYQSISEHDKKPEGFYTAYARALAKAGKLQESNDMCLNALKYDYNNPESYKLMGLLEILTKHPKSALEFLEKAIKLNANDAEPYNLMAYAYLNLRHTREYEKNKKIYEEMSASK